MGKFVAWIRGAVADKTLLSPWPIRRSSGWIEHVNAPETESELTALRRSVKRGCPFGDERWSERMVKQLGLKTTVTPRGRPKIDNDCI